MDHVKQMQILFLNFLSVELIFAYILVLFTKSKEFNLFIYALHLHFFYVECYITLFSFLK